MSLDKIHRALYKLGAAFVREKTYFDGQEALADLHQMASITSEKKVFVNFSECTISHGEFISSRLETAAEAMMEHLRNILQNEGVDLKSLSNVGLELNNTIGERAIFICAEDSFGRSLRVDFSR